MTDVATSVQGECDVRFAPLRALLERNLADGTECGASLAVIQDGQLVVDLWGGAAAPGRDWERDTVVQVWSVTKTMAALTTLVLADRGVFDLDAPVRRYWPAFASDEVLVRHLLAHTSGYAGWDEKIDVPTLLDLDRSDAMLAAQQPWWTPGDGSGYHMISYGHLLDGLVRAATGVPLAEQFHTLIAQPLGADFLMGVPEADLSRCADLIPPPPSKLDYATLSPDSLLVRSMLNPIMSVEDDCNHAPWRRVSVAGANGHGNARSIARAQAVVSHGGELDGVRLLSPETIERIFEVQADGVDRTLLAPLRFGIGYALPSPAAPDVPDGRVCWWTGFGGAVVVNDLDHRVTVAYAMNRMVQHYVSSPRTDEYLRTAFGCLREGGAIQ